MLVAPTGGLVLRISSLEQQKENSKTIKAQINTAQKSMTSTCNHCLLPVWLLWAIIGLPSCSIATSPLFSYGSGYTLPRVDDDYSSAIYLSTPFPFFNTICSRIYVSIDFIQKKWIQMVHL